MNAAKHEVWRTVDLGLRYAFHRIDEPLSLSAIAQATGYSRYHLSRLVRQTTGLSLRRYVSRMRILRARRLLAATDHLVTEIALSVGYSSLGTFSRQFRSLVGQSPERFRAFLKHGRPARATRSATAGIRVRGHVTYRGRPVGLVHVGLFRSSEFVGIPVAESVLDGPGPFTIGPVPPGTYYALAVACCCYRAYPGDVSGAWAHGVAARPVIVQRQGGDVRGVVIPLVDRLPISIPILATFQPTKVDKSGEARTAPPIVGYELGRIGDVRSSGRGGERRMVRRIASVLIYVSDMDRALDFYERLLDRAPSHRDPTTATFNVDGHRIILHRDKLPSRAGVRGAMEFNLEVGDAQAFAAAAKSRGIEASAPQKTPWGWIVLTTRDPDGNVIEIYEIPP